MRRVVVTGLGLVTPLGAGIDPVWRRLIRGESGAGPIEQFDASNLPCRIAASVPRSDGTRGGDKAGEAAFNADEWVEPREQRRMNPFIVFGMAAAGIPAAQHMGDARIGKLGVMAAMGVVHGDDVWQCTFAGKAVIVGYCNNALCRFDAEG